MSSVSSRGPKFDSAAMGIIIDRLADMNATLIDSANRVIEVQTKLGVVEERVSVLSEMRSVVSDLVKQAERHEGGLLMIRWLGSSLGLLAAVATAVAAFLALRH